MTARTTSPCTPVRSADRGSALIFALIALVSMSLAALALVCTIASVVGGMFGYAIGYFLFETIGGSIIQLYGYQGQAEAFRAAYAEWGLWIILIKGLTPIPYKLVTIVSGAAAFNFPLFIAASIPTRGARFFLVAALLKYFGPPIREFVEKHSK